MRHLLRDESFFARSLVFVTAGGLAIALASSIELTPEVELAICQQLSEANGFRCTPGESATLVEPAARAIGTARYVVRGKPAGEDHTDLVIVDEWIFGKRAAGLSAAHALTRTSAVDESLPIVSGSRLAFLGSAGSVVESVTVVDLAGLAWGEDADELSFLERVQVAVGRWQETGSMRGWARSHRTLDRPVERAHIAWNDAGELACELDRETVVLSAHRGEPAATTLAATAPLEIEETARPAGLVPWLVDRLRATQWFGDLKMQWLKGAVFGALDGLRNLTSRFERQSTVADAQEDLGIATPEPRVTASAPHVAGWPPAPMVPVFERALPGEGAWIALDADPFVRTNPGLPAAFVTTWLRADKEREQNRIFVTAWDPRQVALHMEAGTAEPVSATGAAGPGMIPRDPQVMGRLVAGFNGGFQAIHGEFGMQAQEVLYLPPKPYAATVFELDDGTTAFGTWPAQPEIPAEVKSFRQNMTAIVENGVFNPWKRTWWGGTPPGWADNLHTTRSAVCLTTAGNVAYFWGHQATPTSIAAAMISASCDYGMHLDMNPGLAGFEFYNVRPEGELSPLGRPVAREWEHEGTFKDLPGWKYRARRMIRGMQHMNFPLYVQRYGRDFFYLTLRTVLPGPAIPAALAGDKPESATWATPLPEQQPFPYAVVRASIQDASGGTIEVHRIDPSALEVQATATTATLLSFSRAAVANRGGASVVLSPERRASIVDRDASGGEALLVSGQRAASPPSADSLAVGVTREGGHLVVVDAAKALIDAKAIGTWVRELGPALGVVEWIWSVPTTKLRLGPVRAEGGPMVSFRYGQPPAAKRFFPQTPIVAPQVWQPLQAQRVRYFRPKTPPKPRAATPASGGAPASAPSAAEPTTETP
jgi:hypothetical protein